MSTSPNKWPRRFLSSFLPKDHIWRLKKPRGRDGQRFYCCRRRIRPQSARMAGRHFLNWDCSLAMQSREKLIWPKSRNKQRDGQNKKSAKVSTQINVRFSHQHLIVGQGYGVFVSAFSRELIFWKKVKKSKPNKRPPRPMCWLSWRDWIVPVG